MASTISSILGRKVLPAVATAGVGLSPLLLFDDKRRTFGASAVTLPSTASCEASLSAPTVISSDVKWREDMANKNNPFLAPQLREKILRKRMTSVGRFSLKSETNENRSIPTFFLGLSGTKKEVDDEKRDAAMYKLPPRKVFTVSDFEEAWMRRDMPGRHPRFHSTICQQTQEYFEETHRVYPPSVANAKEDADSSLRIKAELDRHASETMHFSVFREDLRNRLEHMLMTPLEVSNKLWEVKISNGLLGSSGAISRAKVDAILNRRSPQRKTAKGGWWRDAKEEQSIPMESVLLFRSHHALADGTSIVAALSDLCDEAEEIRANIDVQMNKWKRRGGNDSKNGALRNFLSRLMRLLKICLWFSLGTLKAIIYQGYLQITTRQNPFDAVKKDAKKKGLALSGRSISWCDAASLDEVKWITKVLGEAHGVTVTVNDLFVSCVTAAVTRQLIEHDEFKAPIDTRRQMFAVPSINVVIPVHLRGGVVMPNESVGNNIGAFVAQCPGEIKHDVVGGGKALCPTERLCRVHKSLLYSKHSPAPLVSQCLAKFCSVYLPEHWTKSIFERANANACVVVSNNRGHAKKLHINGMTVESVAGFLPLPPGIPIGVVVQSYAGTMSLSVTAEKWAVPDADKFLRWVLDEYQRLHEEALKLEKKQ